MASTYELVEGKQLDAKQPSLKDCHVLPSVGDAFKLANLT